MDVFVDVVQKELVVQKIKLDMIESSERLPDKHAPPHIPSLPADWIAFKLSYIASISTDSQWSTINNYNCLIEQWLLPFFLLMTTMYEAY